MGSRNPSLVCGGEARSGRCRGGRRAPERLRRVPHRTRGSPPPAARHDGRCRPVRTRARPSVEARAARSGDPRRGAHRRGVPRHRIPARTQRSAIRTGPRQPPRDGTRDTHRGAQARQRTHAGGESVTAKQVASARTIRPTRSSRSLTERRSGEWSRSACPRPRSPSSQRASVRTPVDRHPSAFLNLRRFVKP
ncbi:MAG: hypothetical protein NTY63_04670 [Candidatus Bipolaricaulota bacterium]|nr:hypothetical protein [Candidatus Bipolaricaulota bacterium]